MLVAVAVLFLTVSGSWLFLNTVHAKEEKEQAGLVQQVEELTQQVESLTARIEDLEADAAQVNSVIHLEPLADFPPNPSEGDICVVGESGNRNLYCYLNGDWLRLSLPLPPTPPTDPPLPPPEW